MKLTEACYYGDRLRTITSELVSEGITQVIHFPRAELFVFLLPASFYACGHMC